MQSRIRLSILGVVIFVMTVAPTFNVLSQKAFDCSTLSAADCKVLQASDGNLAKELSGQFTFEGSYNYTVGSNSGTFNVVGNGSFSRDLSQTDQSFESQAFLNSLSLNRHYILYE